MVVGSDVLEGLEERDGGGRVGEEKSQKTRVVVGGLQCVQAFGDALVVAEVVDGVFPEWEARASLGHYQLQTPLSSGVARVEYEKRHPFLQQRPLGLHGDGGRDDGWSGLFVGGGVTGWLSHSAKEGGCARTHAHLASEAPVEGLHLQKFMGNQHVLLLVLLQLLLLLLLLLLLFVLLLLKLLLPLMLLFVKLMAVELFL